MTVAKLRLWGKIIALLLQITINMAEETVRMTLVRPASPPVAAAVLAVFPEIFGYLAKFMMKHER